MRSCGCVWARWIWLLAPCGLRSVLQRIRLAADQGDALAQTILGNMYRDGRGVVQDYVQAHMWYNLAAAHLTGSDRNQAVESWAAVEAKIPPAQVAEAQKMAREWRPKRENPGP